MAANINIAYQEVPRFQPGSRAGVDYLEEHGYVVIASALSAAEVDQAMDLLWIYLEELGTGVDRHDVATWGDDRWPTAVHGAIIPSQGIGHSAAQWYIRDRGKVKESFAAVWDCEELLVSFDGVSLWRPWAYNPAWKTNLGSSWLHIDQHPIGRPGKHCVQGLVNLLPMSPYTGGNVMIPGSHKRFADIPQNYAQRLARIHPSIDHFRFPEDDPLLADSQPITAHMEPGDLMLWDSRTIHCSSPAQDSGPVEVQVTDELLRAASLICMMPKSKSNPQVIAERKAAVEARISTTNWSDRFINADQFPQVMAAANRDKYRLPPAPVLNRNQLQLVGWDKPV